MNPIDKGMFNGINSQSIGPDKAIKDFNAQLKDIDGEFSKFNSDEPSTLMPIKWISLVRIQDQIHETQAVKGNEAHASHEPTKVSQNPKPLRVLPTWSHWPRPLSTNNSHFELSLGKKRDVVTFDDHSELSSKHCQVFQDDNRALFELVEVDHQPCKAQWVV